jgi:hypothetical protein
MKLSIVHHCVSQEYVAQRFEEPPALKCRCRKQIPLSKATEMYKNGEAKWVVTKRTRTPGFEICSLCNGDPEMKKCANCGGSGVQAGTELYEEYANDIVLVSRAAVDKTEKKYRPALAMKTPRVATIEEEHIELAYVDGMLEAAQRIEEYGRLILEARLFVGPKKNNVPGIIPEPVDDPDEGTGRNCDWGRSPFCQIEGAGQENTRPVRSSDFLSFAPEPDEEEEEE